MKYCKTCRHWREPQLNKSGVKEGLCTRYPPILIQDHGNGNLSDYSVDVNLASSWVFPATREKDGCGEWTDKAKT